MTDLYHGVTVRDAVLMCDPTLVKETNIRKWLSLGNIQRTRDGQIDPFVLIEWWQYVQPRYERAAMKRQQVA